MGTELNGEKEEEQRADGERGGRNQDGRRKKWEGEREWEEEKEGKSRWQKKNSEIRVGDRLWDNGKVRDDPDTKNINCHELSLSFVLYSTGILLSLFSHGNIWTTIGTPSLTEFSFSLQPIDQPWQIRHKHGHHQCPLSNNNNNKEKEKNVNNPYKQT